MVTSSRAFLCFSHLSLIFSNRLKAGLVNQIGQLGRSLNRLCFVSSSHIVQTVDIRLKPVRDDTSSAEQSVSSRVRYEMRLGISGVSAESGSFKHRAVKLMIKV